MYITLYYILQFIHKHNFVTLGRPGAILKMFRNETLKEKQIIQGLILLLTLYFCHHMAEFIKVSNSVSNSAST